MRMRSPKSAAARGLAAVAALSLGGASQQAARRIKLPQRERDEPLQYVSAFDAYESLAFPPGDEACWRGRRRFSCVDSVSRRAECEALNNVEDGFEYRFSDGRTTGAEACGARCSCCRRLVGRSSAPQLSFEACCNASAASARACWARSGGELSFARCCAATAYRRSPLPRTRRIVVAMSTTPPRLGNLGLVIESLARQTHAVDAMYLSLPLVSLRDWSWYSIPWWYTHLAPGVLEIVRCEQDYRTATGILCMLQHEPDPDTYIVGVDDDVAYHPMLVEWLLRRSLEHPGAMIGAMSLAEGEGTTCREHGERGVCLRPNFAHQTYGKLFQRRFFDAGVMNFAMAAEARSRACPGCAPSFDFIVTSCMHAVYAWLEGHLARRGVPRLFFRRKVGGRPIYQTMLGGEALINAKAVGEYHNALDPSSTDAAEDHCLAALSALHGPALWAARPRHVAALAAPRGAGAGDVAALLAGVRWWVHDAAVIFVCSGSTLEGWRQALAAHGGLGSVAYLHAHAPALGRRAPFVSEPFDAAAFAPEPLRLRAGAFRPSAAVPGHEGAGAGALVDVVELCPGAGVGAAAAPQPRECPPARVFRDVCGSGAVQEARPAGFAGVACCLPGQCFSGSMARNASLPVSNCFPSIVTYHDAHRICEAIGAQMCDGADVAACCQGGCGWAFHNGLWLRSPAAAACVADAASGAPAREAAQVAPAAPGGPPASPPERLPVLQEAFLAFSEEARSTVVEWLTARDP